MAARTHEHDGCELKIAMLEDDIEILKRINYELRRRNELLRQPFGFIIDALRPERYRRHRDYKLIS